MDPRAFFFESKTYVKTAIAYNTGTVFGNTSGFGGNGAAFDNNFSQVITSCATVGSGTPIYVGKDWGAGNAKIPAQFRVKSSSDQKFCDSAGTKAITLTLAGSNDGSSYTDLSVINTTCAGDQPISSELAVGTAYRYWRVTHSGGNTNSTICEVEFWEWV